MIIANLAGVFTFEGFAKKQGRFPKKEDAWFIQGPVSIVCNQETGKIVEITKRDLNKDPFGEKIIEASSLIATPGFVDSHSHTLFLGNRTKEFFSRWQGKNYIQIAEEGGGIRHTAEATSKGTDQEIEAILENRLAEMLRAGSTTVEIKTGYGSSPQDEIRYLRILAKFKNRKDLPQVVPTFLGLHWIPPGWSSDSYTKEIIPLLSLVAEEKLAEFVDAFPEKGFYSLENAIQFSKKAQSFGLGLKIHSDELTPFNASETFIGMGAASIDHCQYISGKAQNLLSGSNTVVTLLPATSFYLNFKYADARKLIEKGARVALATDFNPGTAPTESFQLTLFLAASVLKMNPYEIFSASTYTGAAALSMDHETGWLSNNKVADILCWKVDPEILSDGENILEEVILRQLSPYFVIRSGNLIDK